MVDGAGLDQRLQRISKRCQASEVDRSIRDERDGERIVIVLLRKVFIKAAPIYVGREYV